MKDNKTPRSHEGNKVIPFPGGQQKSTAPEKPPVQSPAWKKTNKPVMGLAAVIALATLLNTFVTPEPSNIWLAGEGRIESRSLASVDPHLVTRDVEFENKISSQLAKLPRRSIASIGRVPTSEERLRFEYLEGKYRVSMAAGKIREIELDSKGAEPRYLNDRPEFLRAYRQLMPVEFEEAKNVSREVLPQKILETYELVGKNQVLAEAQFELDLFGRLLSMKVQPKKRL